jgi:hypothetical protein
VPAEVGLYSRFVNEGGSASGALKRRLPSWCGGHPLAPEPLCIELDLHNPLKRLSVADAAGPEGDFDADTIDKTADALLPISRQLTIYLLQRCSPWTQTHSHARSHMRDMVQSENPAYRTNMQCSVSLLERHSCQWCLVWLRNSITSRMRIKSV